MIKKVIFYKGQIYFSSGGKIPTKLSELTNDVGYITSASIPTNVSAFTNDAGYLTSHQDISGKVNKAGDTMTGNLTVNGSNIILGTSSTSSNDSGDLVWNYGNGQEKMRIWTSNEYTAASGPSFRVYKADGTQLFSGTLSLSNHTHSYLPLSGGTLSGNIARKLTGITINTTSNNNVSTYQEANYYIFDNANSWFSRYVGNAETNGTVSTHIQTQNKKTDGTTVQNNLQLGVKKDGTRIVGVSDGAVWRNAIGAAAASHTHSYLPLTGGTLTGSVLLKATNLNKDSNITAWGKELDFYDTNNKRLGLFNVKQYGVRKVELHIGCIDGNENWNEIVLKNDVSVSYYAVTSPINFRSAIGAAASSSKLTKTNIQDMTDDEAKKILDIDVKSFDYKEGFVQPTDIKEKYYGVIAEECLEKIPYAVNVPEGYDEKEFDESKGLEQKLLLMDYPNFVPYLIKMVQIQQHEIDILKSKLS